ncbi:MAG: hypothetical protein JWM41_2976 [Gemmatimonadetes bacterium]|nr:hypothetical protein [Gemmatimonadota bacterium]
MAMTTADLRGMFQRNRVQTECIAVALLATVVFVVLGMALHRRMDPLRLDVGRLNASASEISAFRSAFKPSAGEADLATTSLPESLSVSVPREMRFSLAEDIAARAELSGLSGVRVRFAAPDSTPAPTGPAMSAPAVAVADYTIAVDATGGFAGVLSLVNHLPPSVALQRLSVQRTKTGTQFRLILAVFEAAGSNQHG